MTDACCPQLKEQLDNHCPIHLAACPDNVVVKVGDGDRIALQVPASVGGGYYLIDFCPWCGTKYPPP